MHSLVEYPPTQAEARFNIGGFKARVKQAIATSKGMRTQATQMSARLRGGHAGRVDNFAAKSADLLRSQTDDLEA